MLLTLEGLNGPDGRDSRADIGAAVGHELGARPYAGSPYPLGAGPYFARINAQRNDASTARYVPVPWDFWALRLTQGACGGCGGTGQRELAHRGSRSCRDCDGTGRETIHPRSVIGRQLCALGDAAGARPARERATSALETDHGFEVIDARKYRHVAAILSNGQRTARWSQDKTTGVWYVSKGWKIPNRQRQLTADQAAYVESVIS